MTTPTQLASSHMDDIAALGPQFTLEAMREKRAAEMDAALRDLSAEDKKHFHAEYLAELERRHLARLIEASMLVPLAESRRPLFLTSTKVLIARSEALQREADACALTSIDGFEPSHELPKGLMAISLRKVKIDQEIHRRKRNGIGWRQFMALIVGATLYILYRKFVAP